MVRVLQTEWWAMSILAIKFVLSDAGLGSIIAGPGIFTDGHRVGQITCEMREFDNTPIHPGWYVVEDRRTVGYKLELDTERQK